jgi:FSR family fosmidomycin resistance protein-like MFS transporter
VPLVEPHASSRAARVRARLGAIAISHGVVDFFSALVIPLLSVLEEQASMTPAQGAALIAAGSLSSGIIQPVVALVGDKRDTRSLGTIGLMVAALAIGLIGFADSFWKLLILQVLGAAGIGAFHPPAAAVMGHLSGRKRSMGVSIFFAAGILGGAGGAFTAPIWAEVLGIKSFLVGLVPAAFTAVLLAWATHDSAHRHAHAAHSHRSLPEKERAARWAAVWVLYASNALRFIVNMAMVQILVRWSEIHVLGKNGISGVTASTLPELLTTELRHDASRVNGPLQAAMAIGMGVFGLLIGGLVPASRSRLAMIVTPCVGAAAVLAMPASPGFGVAFAVSVLVGGAYAGTVPLSIAAAQRLLPHRTTLASGLMMGGAWSLALVGPPLAQWIFGLTSSLTITASIFAGVLMLSGVMIAFIPRRLIDQGEHGL